MSRKLIINSSNEITYNTIENEIRKFRKTIKRILDELKKDFDDEKDVDSDPSVQQIEFYEEFSKRSKSFAK